MNEGEGERKPSEMETHLANGGVVEREHIFRSSLERIFAALGFQKWLLGYAVVITVERDRNLGIGTSGDNCSRLDRDGVVDAYEQQSRSMKSDKEITLFGCFLLDWFSRCRLDRCRRRNNR